MNLNCQNILKMTEAQLRYKSDVSLQEATPQELHEALSQAVMMSISENWTKSKRSRIQGRKAHYFSAEYLIGRLVYSNLYNLGILDELKKTFLEVGVDLACMEDIEDAALGNGGLGRLAACFLDSAATWTGLASLSRNLTTMAARRRRLTTGPNLAIPGPIAGITTQ